MIVSDVKVRVRATFGDQSSVRYKMRIFFAGL